MTELAELVAELREEARCLAGEGIGDDLAEKFTKAAAAIKRLEREIKGWQIVLDTAESRALTAEAELEKVREALKAAHTWHEAEDKALSKQPPSHGPNGNQWARLQHQEQMAEIARALPEERK